MIEHSRLKRWLAEKAASPYRRLTYVGDGVTIDDVYQWLREFVEKPAPPTTPRAHTGPVIECREPTTGRWFVVAGPFRYVDHVEQALAWWQAVDWYVEPAPEYRIVWWQPAGALRQIYLDAQKEGRP